MTDNIVKYEISIFEELKTEFLHLIQNIKMNYLSLHNIELLNQINNDMRCLLSTFKEINPLLKLNPTDNSVKQKIKQIVETDKKIKELLPVIIMETLV